MMALWYEKYLYKASICPFGMTPRFGVIGTVPLWLEGLSDMTLIRHQRDSAAVFFRFVIK